MGSALARASRINLSILEGHNSEFRIRRKRASATAWEAKDVVAVEVRDENLGNFLCEGEDQLTSPFPQSNSHTSLLEQKRRAMLVTLRRREGLPTLCRESGDKSIPLEIVGHIA